MSLTLTLTLTGFGAPEARAGAADLLSALAGTPPQEVTPETSQEAHRDLATGLAIAAVVLSVPGAVLASLDIADRLRKRRELAPKVEAAKRVLEVTGTEGTIRIDETLISLRGESTDAILDRLLAGRNDQ